jgi:hypothetical protein
MDFYFKIINIASTQFDILLFNNDVFQYLSLLNHYNHNILHLQY